MEKKQCNYQYNSVTIKSENDGIWRRLTLFSMSSYTKLTIVLGSTCNYYFL